MNKHNTLVLNFLRSIYNIFLEVPQYVLRPPPANPKPSFRKLFTKQTEYC